MTPDEGSVLLARPLQKRCAVKNHAFLCVPLLALSLAACGGRPAQSAAATQHSDMKTIDDITPHPTVTDPPPMLTDEGPPIKPKTQPGAFADAAAPLTEKDQEMRARLPFAPAIAMDPINGSKVSIRADTPIYEYKGHIYYFSSEENKKEFVASPDEFLKGSFARL
jgi:YHS domain-containing protein